MEYGFYISRKDLSKEGWKNIGSYLGYEIWGKEDIRILFDARKKYIFLAYMKKEKK